MPKDYSLAVTPANEQRRPENARDDDWTRAFLVRARVGHVASRWDDQPFITPTTFWYDPERREIYFHSNLVEPVAGNMGVVPPVEGFLRRLRVITAAHGALLIFEKHITQCALSYSLKLDTA